MNQQANKSPNQTSYSDNRVWTPVGVAHYVNLAEPKETPWKTLQFGMAIKYDSQDAFFGQKELADTFQQELANVAHKRWGDAAFTEGFGISWPLDWQPLNDNSGGVEGELNLSAKDTQRPQVLDVSKTPIDPSAIYNGAKVIALVQFRASQNGGNKTVRCTVVSVMKVGDGPRIGYNPVATAKDFDALPPSLFTQAAQDTAVQAVAPAPAPAAPTVQSVGLPPAAPAPAPAQPAAAPIPMSAPAPTPPPPQPAPVPQQPQPYAAPAQPSPQVLPGQAAPAPAPAGDPFAGALQTSQ